MNQPVVIVGGGASGALLAVHLSRLIGSSQVTVIEPRPVAGVGIAYSTTCPCHLLNVPARNMSAFPELPAHFLEWLKQGEHAEATPETFAPRMAYGRYLSELFGVSCVRHIRGTVTAIRPDPSGAVVELASGEKLRAAQTVLALGHFPPVDVPEVGAGVVEAGAYRRDPWGGAGPLPAPDLRPDLAVALIGTGLTSIDMLLSLRGSGHRGEITMISRHGLLSRGHAPFEPLSAPVLPLTTQPETLAYFKTFRKALREGCDWRAATDSLRSVSCALWEKLSFREKYLFRRHLFHYWSVSRHRMAPGIAATIRMELADGRLKVRRGYVQSVMRGRDGAVLTLRTGGGTACADFGRVINCTGPDTQYRRVVSPLLSGLFDNGLAREGDLGVALALDSDGRVVDASGVPHPSLYAIGPMRAGALFETTAIPEIRQQASDLAALVAADYGSDRRFLSA